MSSARRRSLLLLLALATHVASAKREFQTFAVKRSPPRFVQHACADVGWSLWLSMLFVDDPKTTKILTLTASVFFLASSLVSYPDVNWTCVAMQLVMLSANVRRTVRLFRNTPELAPKGGRHQFRLPPVLRRIAKPRLPYIRPPLLGD